MKDVEVEELTKEDIENLYKEKGLTKEEIKGAWLIATDGRTINIDQDGSIGYINIDTYMREMGFMPIETIDLYGGKAKCYTGVKEIQYYDIKKYVYCAFVGGFTDIESYVDLLYNDDGSEEEKFKEIVDIIYDKLQNYTKYGEYCYWVTGMNIAGGVANLLACELKGEECYSYIFNPPNISRSYGEYNYIMNIINTDNLIPKIYKDMRNHINGKRYYNSIRYDLMSVYRKYNNNTSYYKGDFKIANRIKEDIQETKDNISDEEEHKEYFTKLTEELYGELLNNNSSYLYNSGSKIATIDENGEEHIHENITEIDRIYAMNIIGPGADFSLNPVYSQNYKDSAKTSGEARNNPVLIASVDLFAPINIDHDTEIAEKGNTERNQTDEEKELNDFRNGYRFNGNSDYEISDDDYNNSEEDAVMIKPFMYSNYTIKPKIDKNGNKNYKDINYVKFWYDKNGNIPINKEGKIEQLYKYQAGNMEFETKFTYGSETKKDDWHYAYIKNYANKGGKVEIGKSLGHGIEANLLMIKGRILAAFPPALFNEKFENGSAFDEARINMHMHNSYGEPDYTKRDDGRYNNAFCGESGGFKKIVGGQNDMYKYVDVVIEDDNNQQFVVPFITIDAKDVHLLPEYKPNENKGMFSTLTDNRYGQVMEIVDSGTEKRTYYKFRKNDNNKEVYIDINKDSEYKNNPSLYTVMNDMKPIYDDDGKKIGDIDLGYQKTITYSSRENDDNRKASYISPVEPYIYNPSGNQSYSDILTSIIIGRDDVVENPNYKIVSMRLYNERCADDNGNPISSSWDDRQKKIKENTENTVGSIKVGDHYECPEYLNRHRDKFNMLSPLIPNKIVNYE